MRKLLYIGGALIAGSLFCIPALTEAASANKAVPAQANRSFAARSRICRVDCLPDRVNKTGVGMHGLYRSYSKWDPHLVSPEGRKEYAACVSSCLGPLPGIYLQKIVFGLGLQWFGMTQQTCFECHTTRTNPDHVLPSDGVGVYTPPQ